MYTIIVYPAGRAVDALLLSATPERLRLAIRGRADAEELNQVAGQWISTGGVAVELGAMVAPDLEAIERVQANACKRASSAC